MRFQPKPFVIEVKRSRKTTGGDRNPVGSFLVEADPSAPPTQPTSSERVSAEDLFRDIVEPSYLSRDEKRDGTEAQPDPVGNAAPNLSRPAGDRILPDLTWCDPVKSDEEQAPRRIRKPGLIRRPGGATMIQPTIDHDPGRKDARAPRTPRRKSRQHGVKSPVPIPSIPPADQTGDPGHNVIASSHSASVRVRKSP